jgi:hypothetical protein
MTILQLLLLIIAVGILVWAAVTFLPMAEPTKKILVGTAVICLIVVILYAFGLFDALKIRVPKV